ncbi:MAG: KamA family radical SAM protein [Nitrospina sp.]|nr:KamA family radical SAM protein [Nitrospina sp.]
MKNNITDKKPKYLTRLNQVPELSQEEREQLEPVNDKFIFRSNDYYNSLIDWNDPKDPIRKIIIPEVQELEEWGQLDASNEEQYTRAKGLEHKYDSTALLLVNEVCAAYCRFCFRKRLFMDDNEEVTKDISEGLAYIREHPEINNVLLTGGDPLIMSTSKLEPIIRQLREVEHVRIIRIGTKIPAFNPMRIYNDESLREMFRQYSTGQKRIYVMAHFNHPRELTPEAVRGLEFLLQAGAIVINQTPMIAGVNDDPEVLGRLFNELSYIGVPPYYVFHCRPTLGNKPYTMPVEKAYEIFERARIVGSGLAKRARFVMSHQTGKIEVVGLTEKNIYFRYQRAADNRNSARFMVFRRNADAYWFDDYTELVDDGCAFEDVSHEDSWELDDFMNAF